MEPLFITFEGLDGSGKSTHLQRAAGWLEQAGLPHRITHEPGGTPLGDGIRRLFLDSSANELDGTVEMFLVFASRRQHLREVIDPALVAGCSVLCDRFTDSTYAYQGHGRGLSLELIDQVDALATGTRSPDRTLLFDLPADDARRRGHSSRRAQSGSIDRIDREGIDFYRRVREGFLERARADPERFRVIHSGESVERTSRQVYEALIDLLPLPRLEARDGDEYSEPRLQE